MTKLTPSTRLLLSLVVILGASLSSMVSAAQHPNAGSVTDMLLWVVAGAFATIVITAAVCVRHDLRQ